MYRAILLTLVTLLLVQLPALADRDEKTFTKLLEIASSVAAKDTPGDITAFRGGGRSGKALGYYRDGSDVVFRSGYEKQPAKVMADFAYDLAEFVYAKGGGYDHFSAYQKEKRDREQEHQKKIEQETGTTGVTAQVAADLANRLSDKPDAWDPWGRAHVPYNEQRQFAEKWWQSHSPGFAGNLIQKDWWMNDSILDANNMWARCETTYFNCPEKEQADRVLWFDHELKLLTEKK